mmetsp:Transcript_43486/g.138729  ORF Transcript_43486/g.138729 Transcript_43486/m.138729 type:complete len:198 (+) Transcript_43486:1040-1633(+)
MKATHTEGTTVLELDGQRAVDRVAHVLQALGEDFKAPSSLLPVGLGVSGAGGAWSDSVPVINMAGSDGAMRLARHVPAGARVRLEVNDESPGRMAEIEGEVARAFEGEGRGGLELDAGAEKCIGEGSSGAFFFSCVAGAQVPTRAFSDALPGSAVAGGWFQGELCPGEERSRMQAYTTTFGVLQHRGGEEEEEEEEG